MVMIKADLEIFVKFLVAQIPRNRQEVGKEDERHSAERRFDHVVVLEVSTGWKCVRTFR